MKWFYNLKLSHKLQMGFLLVAGVAAIIEYVGLTSTSKVASGSEEMYANGFVPMRELAASRGTFFEARYQTIAAVSLRSPDDRRKALETFQSDYQTINEHFNNYLHTRLNDSQKSAATKLGTELADYHREAESAFALAIEMKDQEAVRRLNGNMHDIGAELTNDFQRLLDANDQLGKNEELANQAIASTAARQIIVFLIAGIVVAMVLGWTLARLIGGPVKQLQEAARRLALGDVIVDIKSDTADEIGSLTRSFQDLAALIKERVFAAERIAAGDLQTEVKTTSEQDVLARSLQSLVATLKGLVQEMSTMSLQHDAGDIDAAIDAKKFHGAFNEVAAGINKMVAGHIIVKKKAMACLAELGRGNFEAPLDKFPGKKAFINDTIEQVRANLENLITDTQSLSDAAIHGRLGRRADASRHQGDFRKIVQGINYILDTIVGKFDAIPKPIQFIDSDYKVQYMNKVGLELLGKSNEGLLGHHCGYSATVCNTDRCTCAIAMKMDGLTKIETNASILGKNYDFTCSAVPLKDANGKTIGAFELLDDESLAKRAIRNSEKISGYRLRQAKKVADCLSKMAEGDLAISLEFDPPDDETAEARKAYDDLGKTVRATANSMRAAMIEISQTTDDLLSAAKTLNNVSQLMTASADETAAQANVVSAASEQVSRNVQT